MHRHLSLRLLRLPRSTGGPRGHPGEEVEVPGGDPDLQKSFAATELGPGAAVVAAECDENASQPVEGESKRRVRYPLLHLCVVRTLGEKLLSTFLIIFS